MSNQNGTFSEEQYVPSVPFDHIADFELLSAAILRGEAEVVRMRRKSDGQDFSVIVVLDWFDANHLRVIPIAKLVDSDEKFEPPDSLDAEPKHMT